MNSQTKVYPQFIKLVAVSLPLAAVAFSIESVTIEPANPATFGTNVTLKVLMNTPSTPAALYKPTETTISGHQIIVKIYPQGGTERRIGLLIEAVSIGALPTGTYDYVVTLYPNTIANWSPQTVQGEFTVAPKLDLTASGVHFVLRWPTNSSNFQLQTTSALTGTNTNWAIVNDPPMITGSNFVMTINAAGGGQFFRLKK